jgi:hypothetical protein
MLVTPIGADSSTASNNEEVSMSSSKTQWSTPQLIVLARGTPEENVLTHCKTIGAGPGGGPETANQDGCNSTKAKCGNCQSRSGS